MATESQFGRVAAPCGPNDGVRELIAALEDTQASVDRMLRQVFDPETRAMFRQAQVHIHEALLLLQSRRRGGSPI